MAREFRRTFSWKDARVHFIGVWYVYLLGVLVFVIQLVRDTVSSVGFGRGYDYLSGSSAAAHACHIRHALALDERRVKFMPEFFLEMNSPDFHDAANDSQLQQPAVVNNISCTQSGTNECINRKTADIKEVWFAGSHSDVYVHVDPRHVIHAQVNCRGGKHRPGKPFHAGNVSLMWMRCEAETSGLRLKPEHVLWTNDDIDFGTHNSMSPFWKLVEILPVSHQVSFSGSGGNAFR